MAYPISPPTSPATVATMTTAARLRFPWLAATPAAPRAAAPMPGTPAQEAMTARNRRRYSHTGPADEVDARTITPCPSPWRGTLPGHARAPGRRAWSDASPGRTSLRFVAETSPGLVEAGDGEPGLGRRRSRRVRSSG